MPKSKQQKEPQVEPAAVQAELVPSVPPLQPEPEAPPSVSLVTNESPKTEVEAPRPMRSLSKVEISESGFLKANDLEGRFRIANAFFKGKMVPKAYESAEAVMVGMEFAIELGLRPLTGLRHIAVINGSPSIWGELPLAICQRTGELEYIKERFFDKDYKEICFDNKNLGDKPWVAVCRIKRKNWEEETRWFTIDDARTAKLLDKSGPWHTYQAIMLKRRARSIALKDVFADALEGLSIAEYDHNILPVEPMTRNVTPEGKEILDAAKGLTAASEAG